MENIIDNKELFQSMGVSVKVKFEKNGVRPYGLTGAKLRKFFRITFRRMSPQNGEMKELTTRCYRLKEPDVRTVLSSLKLQELGSFEEWKNKNDIKDCPENRSAYLLMRNEQQRVASFFSRTGELEILKSRQQEGLLQLKKIKKSPSVVLSLNPLIRVPRIPIEEFSMSCFRHKARAVVVPKTPFFIVVQNNEGVEVSVWRTTGSGLSINEKGELSQYKFHEVKNLSPQDAMETLWEFYDLLSQDFQEIFNDLEKEVGASSSFVPHKLAYGNLIWKSSTPEMPDVPEEILDKVEAKCEEVFSFLLKSIRVTEDSMRGEIKFKFNLL